MVRLIVQLRSGAVVRLLLSPTTRHPTQPKPPIPLQTNPPFPTPTTPPNPPQNPPETQQEDVQFLEAKSAEMADKLERTLQGEVQHRVREQFVRWLDAAVAQVRDVESCFVGLCVWMGGRSAGRSVGRSLARSPAPKRVQPLGLLLHRFTDSTPLPNPKPPPPQNPYRRRRGSRRWWRPSWTRRPRR